MLIAQSGVCYTKGMQITILGDVPSLKNRKQIIYVQGRPRLIPGKLAQRFFIDASKQLLGVPAFTGFPAKIHAVFYFSTRHRRDLDNALTSVLDLLVQNHILEDDAYTHVNEIHAVYGGYDKASPRCEITLSQN